MEKDRMALEAYETVLERLRSKHIRITESRKAIIRYMIGTKKHPSAEMIYEDLLPDYPSMSLATVYNNLKVLVEEGFVTELKLCHYSTTYYDFLGHREIHIACENCGRITDFMDADIRDMYQEASNQTGYQVTHSQVMLYGICPECQAQLAGDNPDDKYDRENLA
ncbi:Fur family transcriptional regulator [Streptococcus dentasini]